MTTTPPAPTITVLDDATPCPRAEVLVTPMPVDAATVTVWRSWSGRTQVVRGANGAATSGDFLLVDYEIPFGVAVTYTCQIADMAGTPSQTSDPADPVTVSSSVAWLHDPLDPTSALPVLVTTDPSDPETPVARRASFTTLTYSNPSVIAPVMGSNLPIGFGGIRQDPSNVPLDIRTTDINALEALRDLLVEAWPLCVRLPEAIPGLPALTYLGLADVTMALRPDLKSAIFTSTGTSILPPGQAIAVNPRTYADLLGESADYAGLLDLYDTYLELLRGH